MNSKCRWGGAIALVIGAAACGGGGGGGNQGAGASATATPAPPPPSAAQPGAAAAGAPITGKTVDIQMVGDASGYHYNPSSVTISPGDGVRWTMVSGGPHNVTFWPDSIPSGAQAVLNANMPTPMSPLTSPLLSTPNQTYTISFAGAPKGVYHFYCTPHLAMGMKGTITVQ